MPWFRGAIERSSQGPVLLTPAGEFGICGPAAQELLDHMDEEGGPYPASVRADNELHRRDTFCQLNGVDRWGRVGPEHEVSFGDGMTFRDWLFPETPPEGVPVPLPETAPTDPDPAPPPGSTSTPPPPDGPEPGSAPSGASRSALPDWWPWALGAAIALVVLLVREG